MRTTQSLTVFSGGGGGWGDFRLGGWLQLGWGVTYRWVGVGDFKVGVGVTSGGWWPGLTGERGWFVTSSDQEEDGDLPPSDQEPTPPFT